MIHPRFTYFGKANQDQMFVLNRQYMWLIPSNTNMALDAIFKKQLMWPLHMLRQLKLESDLKGKGPRFSSKFYVEIHVIWQVSY